MAWGSGKDVLVGIRKAAAWGTDIDVDASGGEGIRVLNYSWSDNLEDLKDASYNGDALALQRTNVGRFGPSFTLSMEAKYEGVELPIALFMGTAGVPSGATTVWTHQLFRAINMNGIFFTLAIFDGVATHVFDSCKFTQMTISCSAGRKPVIQMTGIARFRDENTTINPNITSIAEPSNITSVQWLNGTISNQIADQSGSLANIDLNSWSVAFAREMPVDDRTYTSEFIREPEAGAMTVTGSLVLPHETTTHLTTDTQAGTIKELKLNHALSAAVTEWGIWLPGLKFTGSSGPAPSDKAGMQQTLNFDAGLIPPSGTAPSWTTPTVPMIKSINTETTDPLA